MSIHDLTLPIGIVVFKVVVVVNITIIIHRDRENGRSDVFLVLGSLKLYIII